MTQPDPTQPNPTSPTPAPVQNNDYVLTFTEDGSQSALYIRVSEYVATVFAQALRDCGMTGVELVCNEITARPVTGKPGKRATTEKGSASKSKSA